MHFAEPPSDPLLLILMHFIPLDKNKNHQQKKRPQGLWWSNNNLSFHTKCKCINDHCLSPMTGINAHCSLIIEQTEQH